MWGHFARKFCKRTHSLSSFNRNLFVVLSYCCFVSRCVWLNFAKKYTLLYSLLSLLVRFFSFPFFFFSCCFVSLLLPRNEFQKHPPLRQINHRHLPVLSEVNVERFECFASFALLLALFKVRFVCKKWLRTALYTTPPSHSLPFEPVI